MSLVLLKRTAVQVVRSAGIKAESEMVFRSPEANIDKTPYRGVDLHKVMLQDVVVQQLGLVRCSCA